jgi:Flp pilus assembly pilin Flp
MTIIDYLLLAVLLAFALYAGGRLFFGWLRTSSHEIEGKTSNMPNLPTAERHARED